jgi:CDP-glycerol glycerophosphotransferase (TagB/SpsB family)
MKLSRRRLVVIGAPQFDPYFSPDSVWTRAELAQSMQLDPQRPIITLATLGAAIVQPYDETHLVDFLLKAIADYRITGQPQLVVRLHPASRFENFAKYARLPDVRISHVDGYIPALDWTMTRDDVVRIGNLLRHSNVIISPGSTITLEAAVFDTPTIVPTFHMYQAEAAKVQFDHHLTRHYKRLKELDLVPFVDAPAAMVEAINRCLADRTWYREKRAQLVRDYIQFTDGRSTERVADVIASFIEPSSRDRHGGP